MSDSHNVSHWIELVKHGDASAANSIWSHYFDRLVRAVRTRMAGSSRAVSDEEDIVLSVFDSFYAAAGKNRFPDLADRDGLWRLLLKMSARKIVDKRRRDHRQRRGGDRIIESLEQNADPEIHDAIGSEPSPEMVLMMQESIEQLFSHLGDGKLQDLAVAKLEGYSNAEIAVRFECSERTIERRLHLIREKLQQELLINHDSSQDTAADRRT